MSQNQTLVPTVQAIYAAFGRGDVPAIIETLADDVIWEYGGSDPGVPWLVPRRGRTGVAAFFESLAALEFQRFEPKVIVQHERLVIALVDIDATVKATGKPIHEEDEVHLWHFDERGRVSKFRHRVDTALHAQAAFSR